MPLTEIARTVIMIPIQLLTVAISSTGNLTNYELNNDLLVNYNKAFGDFSLNLSGGGNMLTQQWYGHEPQIMDFCLNPIFLQ